MWPHFTKSSKLQTMASEVSPSLASTSSHMDWHGRPRPGRRQDPGVGPAPPSTRRKRQQEEKQKRTCAWPDHGSDR